MNPRKIVQTIITCMVLSVIGFGLYRLGTQQAMQSFKTDGQATSNAQIVHDKPLYWHDPMVPGQKFDKPGKSPFMEMELVPVYADAANGSADAGTVNISPRVQQNLGVRTAEVRQGSIEQFLVAIGNIAYNERDVVLVQARSNGFVEKLYVRAPFDSVRKGQVLAELYVPDWIAAQEEYLTVKRMEGGGMEGLLDGARQRMRLVGMNEDQIRRVESSAKTHALVTLTAPLSGVVTELSAREGMNVMAGAALFRINGISKVWINAEVPENATAQVRAGDGVEVRAAALPGSLFKGKISAFLPEVNTQTRTQKARIELDNPGGKLVPGMFVSLKILSDRPKDVLWVPSEAVIKTGTRSVVMLAQGEGKFLPVDVEVGSDANGKTEILSGLKAGQNVVISGQFLIDSEASLKGETTRLSDESISSESINATIRAAANEMTNALPITPNRKSTKVPNKTPIKAAQQGGGQ